MRNIARPTLLITDDDRGFRETLGELFARRGFEPMLASNGEEAIEVAQRHEIHVALFDFHMPHRTGVESIVACRQLGINIPYFLLTGDLDDDIRNQVRQIKIFGLLEKPISTSELTHAVHDAMRSTYPWFSVDATG
jgi:DNA-binding NtrC family response regulator